jgi:DNA-binding CsgD family transcriptional regulator
LAVRSAALLGRHGAALLDRHSQATGEAARKHIEATLLTPRDREVLAMVKDRVPQVEIARHFRMSQQEVSRWLRALDQRVRDYLLTIPEETKKSW